MLQRFLLDRRCTVLYLASGLVACGPKPLPPLIAPAAAPASREQVGAWVQATVPAGYRLQRFKWQIRDDRGAAGGRGTVRYAAPAWRYTAGGDTVSYVRTSGSPGHLLAEVREGPRLIGRVDATLGTDGRPVSARLTVPSVPARLDLTFTTSATPPAFTPDLWLPGQR